MTRRVRLVLACADEIPAGIARFARRWLALVPAR
jgi:hypothetical protein